MDVFLVSTALGYDGVVLLRAIQLPTLLRIKCRAFFSVITFLSRTVTHTGDWTKYKSRKL
jgi:hypothetical protein